VIFDNGLLFVVYLGAVFMVLGNLILELILWSNFVIFLIIVVFLIRAIG